MTTTTSSPAAPPPVPGPAPTTAPGAAARRIRVLGAVLASLALVVVAVWAPLSARLTGEEIRLRVAPVDPIDPFRGAYVDLGYPDLPRPAGTFDGGPLTPEEAKALEEEARRLEEVRGTAYVPLVREGEVWVGQEIRRSRPADGPYLTCDDSSWTLRCGIESWFLPQEEARALEAAVRDGSAVATVKVDGRGHAALLGIDPG